MNNSNYCNKDLYLIPGENMPEIVITTSKSYLGGFMYTPNGVFSLCDTSINILCYTLGILSIDSIQSLVNTTDKIIWFNDFIKSPSFNLTQSKPRKRVLETYNVLPSEIINPNSILPPIGMTTSGTVTKYILNTTSITFFRSDTDEGAPDIPKNSCASGFLNNNYGTEIYPNAYIYQMNQGPVSLTPQEDTMPFAVNCTECKSCSDCLWCTSCAATLIALVSYAITNSGCASTATSCSGI